MLKTFNSLFRKKSVNELMQDVQVYESSSGGLRRELSVLDLTGFGIATIIGAGIFSTIGNVAHNGGPAVVFLFLFTAMACGFAALCYAEFSSRIPISGSAYTYAYATFGELVAWIIGWDLLIEYAIGNIAVAISWSDYFVSLLASYGVSVPEYLTLDFLTASRAGAKIQELLSSGMTFDQIKLLPDGQNLLFASRAIETAPHLFGFPLILDLPALLIVFLVTYIAYIGIKESKETSNTLVVLKISIVLFVIVAGAFYITPTNWIPFAPNGLNGVLKGVAGVFFAYIGFDALSTTAEECRNPQKDLPRGMIASLLICTTLYILVALVLTGVVSYKNLAVGDPLAYIFGPAGANIPWASRIISFSAIISMATVLLVLQLGQPRIWMAMSRDGLLPKIFSSIHPKHRTPWFATIITGFVVGIPALCMNLTEVTNLTSIGTLFAFALVSGGVLMLDRNDECSQSVFKVPYFNAKYSAPIISILFVSLLVYGKAGSAEAFLSPEVSLIHKLPFWVFIIVTTTVSFISYLKSLSLIPVLGLLSCVYLMTELGITTWIRFGAWLLVGLFLYFTYGFKHSHLGRIK